MSPPLAALTDALTLQNVQPEIAHFCLDIENFIAAELEVPIHNSIILVAFSGGIDSTALLITLFLLRKRLNITLAAAHLNHCIRPEAVKDQQLCHDICRALSIPFYTDSIDVPSLCDNGAGLEEVARTARYDFLFSLKKIVRYDHLATGHHLNDLAEDCIMRLVRGAGWPALGGMVAFDPQRNLVRPFLLQPKEKLENLLHILKIPYAVDRTNNELFSLRNRIRQTILPLLLQENPNFLARISTLWRQAQLDKTSFEEILSPILHDAQITSLPGASCLPAKLSVTLSKEQLVLLPKSFRLRAYKEVLDYLGQGQVLSETLLKLDQAWANKNSGAVFQFSHGKLARISKQSIIFTKK